MRDERSDGCLVEYNLYTGEEEGKGERKSRTKRKRDEEWPARIDASFCRERLLHSTSTVLHIETSWDIHFARSSALCLFWLGIALAI